MLLSPSRLGTFRRSPAFGLYLAGRSKSERFPYGLYRAETLALLFVGMFIVYAGITMLKEGFDRIHSLPAYSGIPMIPLLTVLLSLIVTIIIAVPKSGCNIIKKLTIARGTKYATRSFSLFINLAKYTANDNLISSEG